MNNLLSKSILLVFAIFLFSSEMNAQLDISKLNVICVDSSSGRKFKATISSITIHHEEQYSYFKDLKKAVKKNKRLKFITSKPVPPQFFKTGFEYKKVEIKGDGKSIVLKNVTVVKNQSRGGVNHIEIRYN